jgi:hypothetical protein
LNRDDQRATERLAYHQQEQAVRQAEKLRLQVLLEVDTVYNRVLINQDRLIATRKSREAASQSADAELKRLQQGVSTSYQVLQLQRNYSQAKSREVAALADFNKSIVDLDLITATLLKNLRINITEPTPPAPASAAPVPFPVPAVAQVSPVTKPVKPAVEPVPTEVAKKQASVQTNKVTLGGRISKFFGRGKRDGQ